MDNEEDELRKRINDYILKCKPKYFNKDDIYELLNIMKNMDEYLNDSKITKIKHMDLKKENKILNTKIDTIKINLEKNMNVQGILIYLDNLKNDDKLIVRVFIKIYLYIFYIMFYILTIYNNKKIINKINN